MTQTRTRSDGLPQRVAAVLFDMDDTLVASEAAWFAAMRDMWRESGGDPAGKGVLGGSMADLTRAYLADFPGSDAAEVERRLRQLLAHHLDGAVVPTAGAQELLARLGAAGLPVTIASNSPSDIVAKVVDALGWGSVFTAALGTEDVAAPKPAPDLYLAAAAACGVDIRECVVFEDSPMGTQAAVAAGAFVVTVGPAAAGAGNFAVDSLTSDAVVAWQPGVIR
jgi:HAD superfamily hydrolase (TIGR01509 family)